MKCPTCGRMLQETTVGNITVDVCENGCGGIWFDYFELMKVDEAHESTGEKLLNIRRDEAIVVDHSKRRECPRCDDQIMKRHFFSIKREVVVDECPACGGFWLDHGELGEIRTQFASQEQRRAAAEAYFSDVFGDDMAKMRIESQAKLEKARSIAKIFRFICPSYYIPGKKEWRAS